ncbi:MAG TPA: LacI family DNA-binding transcriptional regulator [Spirochaetia bacterium]|nr:LacI family DNA-binding transcriptional regulator [Spirochaetia bacterium]
MHSDAGSDATAKSSTLRAPTLKEIALHAKVSEATVSRVINNRPNVHPDTVSKVNGALKQMDVDLNALRRRNRSFAARSIALLVPDITNPVFPMMMKGIEHVARTHGYNLIVCDSENDPSIERERLESLVADSVDGLIWIPTGEAADDTHDDVRQTLPTVFLDRRFAGKEANCVVGANEDGAYQATRYLLSLGHRRILFVGGPVGTSTAEERFQGFKRALGEQGIEVLDELILRCDFTMSGAYTAATRFLASGTRVSGVFASNDAMAFGVLKALREARISVPEEMSIIGYDDIPYAEFVGLSTVAQPAFDLGRNAMILLTDVLGGRVTAPQIVSLRPVLTIRDSCRKI